MLAEQYNAVFSGITGPVRSVTGSRPSGEPDIGDGLSTRLTVGEVRISVAYWRLMQGGTAVVSSIEDGQRLGGDPIDALGDLESNLVGRQCLGVAVDPGTGDLLIAVSGDVVLHAFRFRQLFEDWEVTMPDGEAYWSNLVSLHR